jgi:phosphocarrier protein
MQLCEQDIFISHERVDKLTALQLVCEKLVAAGNTTPEYLQGMLAREAQISTYLGHGIAIPHGTADTRHAVLNTGVKVIVFPQGVDWGEGNVAFMVAGIAARSNEHLDILRQLTRALSDESVPHALAQAATPAEVLAILTGNSAENAPHESPREGEQATFVIRNPHGLHARPSAVLVKLIKQFQSRVIVENIDNAAGPVDGKNLMKVVSLGAKMGHRMRFTASGTDARRVLAAIGQGIDQGLGETPSTPPEQPKRSWLARLFS